MMNDEHYKTTQEIDEAIKEAQAKLIRLKIISKAMKDRFEEAKKLNEKINNDYAIS